MPRSMRGVGRCLSLCFAFTLLVGCQAAGGSGGDSAGESAAGGEHTVQTRFGEVTVPANPERVVALGWGDAETALALGVQPVGASDWLDYGGKGVGPWAEGLYKKAPELVGTQNVDFEEVAALHPDVILNTSAKVNKQTHAKLSKIAPVISPPKDVLPYGTSWHKQVSMVAQALGKTDKGEKLIAETERAFEQAAKKHPEFEGKTVALGAAYGGKYSAYVSGDSRVEFMTDLGFENKPAIDKLASGNFHITVSEERLDLLSADLTVMFPIGSDATKLHNDKLLHNIPSAKKGHLVILDDKNLISAFSSGSVLAIQYAIEHAVPIFAKALNS